MVTLEEVLVTLVRLLGGAEGAVGKEGKGVSHLQSVADPELVKGGEGEAQEGDVHTHTLSPAQPRAKHGSFECSSILSNT